MRGPFDEQAGDPSFGEKLGVPRSEASGGLETLAVGRLKRRADFLHVGKGRRWHGNALTLQASRQMSPGQVSTRQLDAPKINGSKIAGPRIGFTLTKRVGCAVVRNRARRRLREAVRLCDELPVRRDHDYVVVGRIDAIRLSFDALKDELVRAMRAVHQAADGRAVDGKKRRGGRNAGTDSVRGPNPSRSGLERTRPKS